MEKCNEKCSIECNTNYNSENSRYIVTYIGPQQNMLMGSLAKCTNFNNSFTFTFLTSNPLLHYLTKFKCSTEKLCSNLHCWTF